MTVASMGTPGNPLVGGRGTLIRDSIHSRDYVAGVSGWTINSDGTAEFNGVTIRGTGVFGTPGGQRVEITATGHVYVYDTANQLVASLDADGLLVRDPASGSYARLTLSGGLTTLNLQPPDQAGHTYGPGQLYATSEPTVGDAYSVLVSPVIDGQATAEIRVYGHNSASLVPESSIYVIADDMRIFNAVNPVLISNDLTVGGMIRGADTIRYHKGFSAIVSVTAAAVASLTQAVVFGVMFASTPRVFVNINGSAGAYARWGARAINVTPSGFDIFLYSDTGLPASFTVDVAWSAIYPG